MNRAGIGARVWSIIILIELYRIIYLYSQSIAQIVKRKKKHSKPMKTIHKLPCFAFSFFHHIRITSKLQNHTKTLFVTFELFYIGSSPKYEGR